MSYKKDAFETEINFIQNDELRALAIDLIEQLPDYTFKIAASSTGKYHPNYTNGEGGLVRHTKAAIRIALELLRLESFNNINSIRDYIIIALLLHDGWKHGAQNEDGTYAKYSTNSHPRICHDWLVKLSELPKYNLYKNHLQFIASLILTHMGQWNFDDYSGSFFAPKPQNQEQLFVHICDYLASRKCLEMNFEIPYSE